MSEITDRWEEKARNLLKGRVVTGVRYMDRSEVAEIGWSQGTLVLQLEDPKSKKEVVLVFASRDDEGNDAGALFTDDLDLPVIPVIRDGAL